MKFIKNQKDLLKQINIYTNHLVRKFSILITVTTIIMKPKKKIKIQI